ncbi:MAG: hypothetical protein ACI3XQ_10675 [Eubacteriales bacterium]
MKFSRIIALLMAVLLCLPTIIACVHKGDNSETTAGESVTTEPEVETDEYLDGLDRSLDFGGKTVTILWRGLTGQFSDERTGDLVENAMYDRDSKLKQRLNVNIKNIGMDYSYATRAEYFGNIQSSVLGGGEDAYDIVSGHYIIMPGLVAAGYLYDMNSMNNLDFSRPWWGDGLVEETTVNGRLYLATGDINGSYVSDVYCIYFNQTLIKDNKLEDPYQLVRNGEWTLEKMETMIKGLYKDLDSNQTASDGDRYGLCVPSTNYVTPFMFAMGMQLTSMNQNNYPEIVCKSDKGENVVERIKKLLYENEDVKFYNGDKGQYYPQGIGQLSIDFGEGQYMFAEAKFSFAKDICNAMDNVSAFGILPLPKYDKDQDGYYTCLGEENNLFGITINVADTDMVSAVLEAMSAYSYQNVSTAYYEKQLKLRYSADSEMSQMFDLIRNGVTFCFGSIYGCDMNLLSSWFKDCIGKNEKGWSTYVEGMQGPAEEKIQDFFETVKNLK